MISEYKKTINNNINNEEDINKEANINTKNKKESLIELNNSYNFFNFNFDFEKDNMPPSDLIKKGNNNRLMNYEIYRLLLKTNNNNLKNLKFKENIFDIENIYNDGNCFYRAISSFICTSEQYRIFFRNLVYDYINNNYNDIIVKSPYIYYNGKAIDI